MLFIIHGLDHKNGLDNRLAHYPAHREFLENTSGYGVDVLMSGPLTSDDGATMIRSFFLVEAPDRATVEAFHHADPFFKAGVWDSVTITGFLRRKG